MIWWSRRHSSVWRKKKQNEVKVASDSKQVENVNLISKQVGLNNQFIVAV